MKPLLAVIAHVDVFVTRFPDYFLSFWIKLGTMATCGGTPHVHWLFLLWLTLCFVGSARATIIVILYTADSIVIGADSLRIDWLGGPSELCKINQTSGVYFAFDGVTSN